MNEKTGSDIVPRELKIVEANRLQIIWSDGQQQEYDPVRLRSVCPCATCREKRNAPPPSLTDLNILSPQEAQPMTIQQMEPVGQYAYKIVFSDGHDSGIFTFDLLRTTGEPNDENLAKE